jgi:AcrR family transcriptional regulator
VTPREALILETAGPIFAARGYTAASMDEIALAAGVSKPVLYSSFGSKDGLYFAYIERAGAELLGRIRSAGTREGSPDERLWAGTLAFFTFVEEYRDGYSVLFAELAAGGATRRREVAAIRRRIVEMVAFIFDGVVAGAGRDASDVGGVEALAVAYVGAGESLANWWLEHPEESTEAVAARLMDVAWLGLDGLLAGRTEGWAARLGVLL